MSEFSIAVVDKGDWRQTPDYRQAQEHLERAEWTEAAAILVYLLSEHPGDPALQALLAETQLRVETEKEQQVRGRRLPFLNRRFGFGVALVAILVALLMLAQALYNNVIAPSIVAAQEIKGRDALAVQAQQALAAGDYQQALDLYRQLAVEVPNHPDLADGVARAKQAQALEARYQLALQQLNDGEITAAQATLVDIQEVSPNYRDVSALLTGIERQQRVGGLRHQAEEARAAENWEEAIIRLEEARTLTAQGERAEIEADLFEMYRTFGALLVEESNGEPARLSQAIEVFSKALSLQPQERECTSQRQWARQYLEGHEACAEARWDDCIAPLESLHTARPDYLDGRAAQMLYNAYMRSAEPYVQEGSLVMAWERYYRASEIEGVDTSTARALMHGLGLDFTPTPAPSPAVAADQPVAAGGSATPTPATTEAPLSAYKGMIVFYTKRGGAPELWIMDATGRNAIKLPDQERARQDYQRLRDAEIRSPDGQRTLFTAKPDNDRYPQIFISQGNQSSRLTQSAGASYDPVWSPTGHWIAFVSSQLGNDEIFVIGADGQHQKRLTNNDWEWDKHPSWSPDGKRLVFWSNRGSGQSQIWVMDEDGGNPTNISNNTFEEWDPIWIK